MASTVLNRHHMKSASPSTPPPPAFPEFTEEQKRYLEGVMAGALAACPLPFVGLTPGGLLTGDATQSATPNLGNSSEPHVHGTPVSDLCKEERWKHAENPLDAWDRLIRHAEADQPSDPEHTYRFKTYGLFHVAPAQDSFMIRLRIPAGEITTHQWRGLADLADEFGNGVCDITTRANIQLREFRPRNIVDVLTRVQELGLTSRGSGADNVRNITATPTSGFDRDELIDVRPYARSLHHYILNHRDLYGLPRKFNIAFDSGGSVSAAVDTNDIGFFAVRVPEGGAIPAGVYFRVELGGITGHGDFSRDTGLLLRPDEAVPMAAAMLRVFIEHGDRTDRKKARLKYLLEKWGMDSFVEESLKKLSFAPLRLEREACAPRRPEIKHGHIGVYRQSKPGQNYIGAHVPVGRMTSRQMRRVADLADNFARGELRLTVWQNFLIPHVPDAFVSSVTRSLERIGFTTEASAVGSGIIACTGNKGCKYAAADTKGHAIALMRHLRNRHPGAFPLNIHLTGCPHSCAQHYCGDIGGVGTKLADGREGYHLVVGGGMGHEQGIGREVFRGVAAEELPGVIDRMIATYLARRSSGESFVQWSRRHSIKEIQEMLST